MYTGGPVTGQVTVRRKGSLESLGMPASDVFCSFVGPDGEFLLMCPKRREGRLELWDLRHLDAGRIMKATHHPEAGVLYPQGADDLTVSRSGCTAVVSLGGCASVLHVDTRTMSTHYACSEPREGKMGFMGPHLIDVSPDGDVFYMGTEEAPSQSSGNPAYVSPRNERRLGNVFDDIRRVVRGRLFPPHVHLNISLSDAAIETLPGDNGCLLLVWVYVTGVHETKWAVVLVEAENAATSDELIVTRVADSLDFPNLPVRGVCYAGTVVLRCRSFWGEEETPWLWHTQLLSMDGMSEARLGWMKACVRSGFALERARDVCAERVPRTHKKPRGSCR